MIVPYLEVDKIIVSDNGKFVIKELIDGYILLNAETEERVMKAKNINDFRDTIGEIKKQL